MGERGLTSGIPGLRHPDRAFEELPVAVDERDQRGWRLDDPGRQSSEPIERRVGRAGEQPRPPPGGETRDVPDNSEKIVHKASDRGRPESKDTPTPCAISSPFGPRSGTSESNNPSRCL